MSDNIPVETPTLTDRPSEEDSLSSVSTTTTPSLLLTNSATSIRTKLSNILLLLFRYHPSGVLASELSSFYQKTFLQNIVMNEDMIYLMCTHRGITCVNTHKNGLLFVLNSTGVSDVFNLDLMNPAILHQFITEHILRLFDYFPNGIANNVFVQTLANISDFNLAQICGPTLSWQQFVVNIPSVVCFKFGQCDILINTSNLCAFQQFNATEILTKPGDYSQIFQKLDYTDKSKVEQLKLICQCPFIAQNLCKTFVPFYKNNKFDADCLYTLFLGGLKMGTTEKDVLCELVKCGVVVLNCSQIKYKKFGFMTVTLCCEEDAAYLIKMKTIEINGVDVSIRKFTKEKPMK